MLQRGLIWSKHLPHKYKDRSSILRTYSKSPVQCSRYLYPSNSRWEEMSGSLEACFLVCYFSLLGKILGQWETLPQQKVELWQEVNLKDAFVIWALFHKQLKEHLDYLKMDGTGTTYKCYKELHGSGLSFGLSLSSLAHSHSQACSRLHKFSLSLFLSKCPRSKSGHFDGCLRSQIQRHDTWACLLTSKHTCAWTCTPTESKQRSQKRAVLIQGYRNSREK